MNMYRQIYIKIIPAILCLIFTMSSNMTVEANSFLTKEEKAYIEKSPIIKAASLNGVAPIQYTDGNGEIQGISKRVIDKISDMTGLVFECKLYDSLDEISKSDYDILFGVSYNYAFPNMILSKPFLKSETILYTNSSSKIQQLDDKIYAAVKGSALPEGIKEENSIYYKTREESINAVENGQADYGYGNAYSVAFYTLQNGYKNIVSIPKGKESREYCIGFSNDDEILISIINKSLSEIDENQMQSIILDVISHIDRKITLSMVVNVYGKGIFIFIFFVIIILLISVISNVQANNKLRMQNKRHEALSEISNEYLYEYSAKRNHLELSEKCIQLFGTQETFNKTVCILKNILSNNNSESNTSEIKLPLDSGEMGVFKIISLVVLDEKGSLDSIIGKLIDISEEAAEKKVLVNKSQVDGLTGLYNAITTKELILDRINNRSKGKVDAFILLDLDFFKKINDEFGHLMGDKVLEHVGKNIKLTFRNTDIVGRIGGDEFCVYMKGIPSVSFVQIKCQQLLKKLIYKENEDVHVSISIGISLVNGDESYEDLFKMADEALYKAKENGRGQIVIF